MQDKYLDAVILARRTLTKRITEFLIAAADGQPLPMAEAGSHIELRFGGAGDRFLRHYSLIGPLAAGAPREAFWRVAVRREDRARGSAFIHRTFQPGTRLRVSRPINAFRLSRRQPHTLLVAGGIGITPIFAMARSLLTRQEAFSVLYVGVEQAQMAYVGELAAMCGPGLAVFETGRQGMPDLKAVLSAQPADATAYVCGPSGMIDGLIGAGAAIGWAPERIRFEVFNAAHRPEDQAFEVRLKDGRAIPIGAGTTILDALEGAGVETYADCRRGECGLCTTAVLGCDGALDHRDRVYSAQDHARNRQMTICCSRITGRLLELDL
ncbi:PDR/VanB family oxidoreductase [Novosphingobium rosa]|uniref:PDR/VanB family oxidoreductase n=1 Tax=Novosphingobium rosa TaxID=76978 RepID=UPI000834EDE3|nr:PDR/VanB family oxidoreductase [Novosphingobium rosa]